MFGHNDGIQPPANNYLTDNADTPHITPVDPTADTAAAAPPAPAQEWKHPDAPTPTPAEPASAPLPPAPHDDAGAPHDLIDLKQKALGQLTPLVGHLDQTPEEKFRTLMMMIQATDDQSMLQEAYDTAQKITDEKTKAQALLDVVNEINYSTQHKS